MRRADAKASERFSQKTYKRFFAAPFYDAAARSLPLQKQWCFSPLLFSSSLILLFPPFFLPYLRQLRQVPVMPGGAAETLFMCKNFMELTKRAIAYPGGLC